MKRRRFCRSAVATDVAAFPFGRALGTLTQVTSDIPAVTLSGGQAVFEKRAVKEFGGSLQGDLLVKGDSG
jgi:hypothetical protein